VDVVQRGIGDHPIYKSMLGESTEQVARLHVSEKSKLLDKTLGELRLSKTIGAYIRAIRRRVGWIYNPDKDTKILEGDVLIVKGDLQSINGLNEML